MSNMTEQVWQAIDDYQEHTTQTMTLDDISDAFVRRLVDDTVESKRELRELLRKSPGWNEKFQAVVINGTRTHDPDYGQIRFLAYQILDDEFRSADNERHALLEQAVRFFCKVDEEKGIEAIKTLAPRAYQPNKKRSRVFKALCDALGVTDETKGSMFQNLFAEFADELNGQKLNFKLFLSIHPAHFLTMSNPKNDIRGETLTGKHLRAVTLSIRPSTTITSDVLVTRETALQ